ncbi:MAG: type II secretion system protein [Candidatus Paceibacterota bacterium]|jgi:prepilin-type N-terminal cleavage/methylation domain-containing protein
MNRTPSAFVKAFTLIELLVVIGLFTLMAFFAVAHTGNSGKTILEGAEQTVYLSLEKARNSAMGGVGGEDHGVEITADGVYKLRGNPAVRDGGMIPFPAGVTAAAANSIIFNRPSGATAASAVTLTHTSGISKTVDVNSLGTVSVQ